MEEPKYSDFELDDISALYYTYLSIETWDVEAPFHPIFLNDQKIGYLNRSIDSDPNRGNTDIPYKLEATQIYLPKRFFRQGLNTLEIKAWFVGSGQWQSDSFSIGRLDIVVVKVRHELQADKAKPNDKPAKRYFPKQLDFFSKLTDEELYISAVQLPSRFAELNLGYGIYRKKLIYIYSKFQFTH